MEVNYLLNREWTSVARSIPLLSSQSYIEYKVNAGNGGVFVGLGPSSMESYPIGAFLHGIMIDGTGIKVFESGAEVKVLKSSHAGESKMRITVQPDRTVVYMVNTNTESLFYKSNVPAQNTVLYGYGKIYSSGDVVIDTGITEGQVQFGRA